MQRANKSPVLAGKAPTDDTGTSDNSVEKMSIHPLKISDIDLCSFSTSIPSFGYWLDLLLKMDKEVSFKFCLCPDPNCPELYKRLLRMCMKLLEITGHGVPWILFSIISIFKYTGETQEFFFNLLVALLLDLFVVGTTKYLTQRKRPDYNRSDMIATVGVDNYSFPSGHTTRGVMVTILFWSFLENYFYKVLILQWSVILALSRIMMGRHHTGDVICGAIIGFCEAWLMQNYIWSYGEFCLHLYL